MFGLFVQIGLPRGCIRLTALSGFPTWGGVTDAPHLI
jgi:hypothetical protein